MFTTILLIIMFSLMSYNSIDMFRKNKRYLNKSYDIKHGHRCYLCKEKLEREYSLGDLLDKTENLVVCKSCERDSKLDNLLSNKNKLNLFKKYLISKKSDNLILGLLVVAVAVLIIHIILFLTINFKGLGWVSNFILVIYWILMIIRFKLTTIKKPSE